MTELLDVNSFLAQAIGDLSTTRIPVPAGIWKAQLTKIDCKFNVPGSKDPTKVYHWATFTFRILDQEVQEALEKDDVFVNMKVAMDLTDKGRLSTAKGANADIGLLAVSCGVAGPNFTLQSLLNQICRVKVFHEASNDGTDAVYAKVRTTMPEED